MPTRRPRRLAALLVAAILVAGCGNRDATPSPLPTGRDPIEVYREIAAQIVDIRGLDDPDRSDPKVIGADELLANLKKDFETSNPEAQILLGERVYKALGLLAPDASLEDLYIDLQGSQVIGYYDPKVDELFIVDRSEGPRSDLGPTERLTYAHEFTHELQDRHFDLESLGLEGSFDEGDRSLAVLGLVEGDATSAQTTWMTANLTPAELGRVAAEAASPDLLAVLGRTPAILLETSLFPYQAGATFVSTLIGRGGYAAVNDAYGALPESTEQVLHPEKYLSHEAPVDVALPGDLASRLGSGWTLDAQDTLGELQLRVWLREGGVKGDVARTATEGWGGDRIGLLGGTDGDVVVLVSEWDTRADAEDFAVAALMAIQPLGGRATAVTAANRVVIAIATSDTPGNARLAGLADDLLRQ